ncbi:MAG TPA: DUF4836 family protein, partial [Chitinophagaceae bacterium]|nr:DUF4836 family protein [Chitinophagaceae bacterium]
MKRTPLLFLLAFVLVLASCKNGNKGDLFIPKDAAVVFHISTSSLSSKLSWEEIKKTTWFQDAYNQKSTDSFARKLMDNPDASGIDVKSDFVFFMKKRGRGGFNVFEGSIKDAAAFEALVKQMTKKDKVEKDGDWSVMTTDDNSVTMWNASKFAVINDMPLGNMNPMGGNQEQTRFGADSLKLFVKQVMTLEGDESLYDDDRFASVMKDGGDMHFWMNSSAMYSDMAGMMSMMKIGNLLKDNVSAGTISFEDGKIAARMKQFFGKEMQKAMEDWKFKNIDASVLNRIPSQNVIGVMAMNMDPQGLKEFFKTIGVDGFINMFLSEQNLTIDEVMNATKGDFVVAVSDLQMKDTTMTFATDSGEKPFTYQTRKPDMDIVFATSVNQKSSFDKLLNTFKKESPELPFTYQLNNEWFVAGNKPATINSFIAGGNTKHEFTEKISGHPFGFYLDIQRLLKTNFTEDAAGKTMLQESAAVWKDVVAVGNEFKDGVMTSEIVVNMVDSKTNSLKQLNQFI